MSLTALSPRRIWVLPILWSVLISRDAFAADPMIETGVKAMTAALLALMKK
jgi:hypothetical protein